MFEYDPYFDDVMTIIKQDAAGTEQYRYEARVVERGDTWVCVRAPFNRDRAQVDTVTLLRGDIFTEWFFNDRWYNIFRIEDHQTQQLKAWYCNLTRPAEISEEVVMAQDLALDVLVLPDGSAKLLDEDEYAALKLSAPEDAAVQAALAELRMLIDSHQPPFEALR